MLLLFPRDVRVKPYYTFRHMTKTTQKKSNKSKLLCFAGLWGLMDDPKHRGMTRLEAMKRSKAAGFDGIAVGADGEMIRETYEVGLDRLCGASCNETNFAQSILVAHSTNSRRINVQFYDHDTPPKVAVRGWLKLERFAEQLGASVDLEVHRDTCTETPEKTWEIADRYQQITGRLIRMNFDFSHFALTKHIGAPYANRLLEHPELIQNARQLHLRAFNGHHCQIPVVDAKGKLTPEGRDYLEFVDALLKCWLKGAKHGEDLCIMPEQLTWAGYQLDTFPPVWNDMCVIMEQARKTWAAVS